MRWSPALLLVSTVACNALVGFGELERLSEAPPDESPPEEGGDATTTDAGKVKSQSEAGAAKPPGCDPTKPFGTPVLLPGPVNAPSAAESSPSLSEDELTIVFGRITGTSDVNMLIATRKSFAEPFGEPRTVPGVGVTQTSHAPTMTNDGLVLFWSQQVINSTDLTITSAKIVTARRATTNDAFGAPEPFRQGTDNALRTSPFVTHDGSELYFAQFEAPDIIHIYRSTRGDLNVYDPPVRVNELASSDGSEGGIAMTKDGLTMYFASSRSGSVGANDVYTARRQDRSSKWTDITRVPELSSPSSDRPGWLSPDGCRLYMGSEREPGGGLFVATKPAK